MYFLGLCNTDMTYKSGACRMSNRISRAHLNASGIVNNKG